MFNPDEQNSIRKVKIKEGDTDTMYLLGSERFESLVNLQTQFDEAANILKSTIIALRAMGLLKKVDYKMLQLSNHSIRTYCDQHIKFYEPEKLELANPLILDKSYQIKNNMEEKDSISFDTTTLDEGFEMCFEMLGKTLQNAKKDYKGVDDFLEDVGKNTHNMVTSIISTVCMWYDTGKSNNEKYQNELFVILLKQTGKNLYKLANSKRNFMSNVKEFERKK